MRVACIQLRSGTDITANIETANRLVRQAAQDGARLIATPEMTHILQRASKNLFESIKPESADLGVKVFSSLAAELNIHLIIGSLAIRTDEARAANRCFLFGPDGEIKARYDKIHLFDVSVSKKETWKESNIYDRGTKAVIGKAGAANIGLSICYDLRFAHLYRHYAQSGADIITVPAAFTRPTGEAHWHALLKSRAIETGAFILAPAQGGAHEDGRETYGHSLIINPWGEIISELDHDEPGILSTQIDLDEVRQARQRIPAWNHNPHFET